MFLQNLWRQWFKCHDTEAQTENANKQYHMALHPDNDLCLVRVGHRHRSTTARTAAPNVFADCNAPIASDVWMRKI